MVEIVLIGALGLVALGLLWSASTSWRDPSAKMYADLKASSRGEHEYRVLAPDEPPPIERPGYEEHDRLLSAEGFRSLGRFENVTLTSVYPEDRTYVACYVSEDGRTCVGTAALREWQILDLGSVLADGRFVETSSVVEDRLTPPPGTLRETHPVDTPFATLLERHRERLSLLVSAEPSVEVLAVPDLESLLTHARRQSRLRSEYRRSLGLITLDEMLSMAGNDRERRTARALWKGIQRRWARERDR